MAQAFHGQGREGQEGTREVLLLLGGMQGWGAGMEEGVREGCRKGVQGVCEVMQGV